ncbi:MAG: NFACT family protein [SAR324 cluster bacterium]|nr:NFACT family protein [SAR324 cluster bacterium]
MTNKLQNFQNLLRTRIQKITQPLPHCLMLEVFRSDTPQQWLFSVHAQFPRIIPSWKILKSPPVPPIFCLWLRTRVLHAEFTSIEALGDQLWQFELSRREEQYFLIWEENGADSNLLLLDEQKCLLMALSNPNQSGRILKQNMSYNPPLKWHPLPNFPNLPQEEQEIDACYWEWELSGELSSLSVQYRKFFKSLNRRLNRRLSKQHQDLENCRKSEQYRQWGELLKPHLSEIKSGQTEIKVANYFEEHIPAVRIPLNPKNSPRKNMAGFFQKSVKLENAVPHVEKRIRQTMKELEILNQKQDELNGLERFSSFQVWENALPRFLKIRLNSSPIKTKTQAASAEPLTRLSSDGLAIVVGRNKHQNARVTFSIARGNHWWFHAQGVPGSHVIVKSSQPFLPPQTLMEAAQLAAYYCKVRANRKIEVDYTQRKYVRKIKGAEPGTVTYSQNKTILVELDDSLLEKLLEK